MQPSNLFEVQGYVYDKFYNGPRQAGNHLYRTSLLKKALTFIPEEGLNIRPEAHVLEQMDIHGFPRAKINQVLGLHDFEQYYSDIYRKSFIQAYKHLNYAEKMVTYWKEMFLVDKDFEVALHGFADGIRNTKKIYVDKSQEIYKQKFSALNIEEKDAVSTGDYELSMIECELKNRMKNSYSRLDLTKLSMYESNKYLKGFKTKMDRHGIVKSLILSMGLGLLKLGRMMRDYVVK